MAQNKAATLDNDIQSVHPACPALKLNYLYVDNAGGSAQYLGRHHLAHLLNYLTYTYSNVQLGLDYFISANSTRRVAEGSEAAKELSNTDNINVNEVTYGSSSTTRMLVENLPRACDSDVQLGDEIQVTTGEHECKYRSLHCAAPHRDNNSCLCYPQPTRDLQALHAST